MDMKKLTILAALGLAAFVVTRKATAATVYPVGSIQQTPKTGVGGLSSIGNAIGSLFSGQPATATPATIQNGVTVPGSTTQWTDPMTGPNAIWGNLDAAAVNPANQYTSAWVDPMSDPNFSF
jgi:hypothetical protein